MTTDRQFQGIDEEMAWRAHAEAYVDFMIISEAAEEFGIPPETLRWACREGWIVSEKRYGRWRFTRQALLNWMAEPQRTGRPRKWKRDE